LEFSTTTKKESQIIKLKRKEQNFFKKADKKKLSGVFS